MKYSHHDPLAWIEDELAALDSQGLRRALVTHAGSHDVRLRFAQRELINFGSNDYLGLAADPRLTAAAADAARAEGWGAGASPLVTGHAATHARLEQRLAEFEGAEAALIFSSGYAANVGTIAALAGRQDAIYADQKNHASMIDGCRLSRADVHIYSHCDPRSLETLLQTGASYRRRLVVTESLFSMDGDLAPLGKLADLAQQYQAMLVVDEAHATGVFGTRGRGVCEQAGEDTRVDVRIGTLSKALGSAGGFVCGRCSLVEWLINRARPYVFSTAQPAASSAAALAALDIVRDEPSRRVELLARATLLRAELREQGWNILNSAGQIIPLVIGDVERTRALACRLTEQGLFVPAIRPPSVPHGASLLRISLSWAHTAEMIEQLTTALAGLLTSRAGRRS